MIISEEDKFVSLYVSVYKYLHNSILNTINFYQSQCRLYEVLIDKHMKLEPFVLFKKSHLKWKTELEQLQLSYEKSLKNYVDSCEELVVLFSLF